MTMFFSTREAALAHIANHAAQFMSLEDAREFLFENRDMAQKEYVFQAWSGPDEDSTILWIVDEQQLRDRLSSLLKERALGRA